MKVCFVGSGSIGKRHIRNWVRICNEMNVNLEIHLLRTKITKLEEDIEGVVCKEVLDKQELDSWYDIIFITNPTFKHYDTICELQDRSSHFFIEKPVFETSDRDLTNIQLKDKMYYVACPLRYTKILQDAIELFKNEKAVSARAISSSYLPEWRSGIDYRNTYSAHREQGGGVRSDLIHEWDYLIAMFGFPKKVLSYSGKYSNLEIDSDDIAVYIALYQDKIIELHLDYFGKQIRRQLEVRTNENEYIFDIANSKLWVNGSLYKEYKEDPNDKYICEMRTFFDIVYNKKNNPNDILKAIDVLKITNQ